MLPARAGHGQIDTRQEPRAGFRLNGYQKARGGLVFDAASYAGVGIATRKWKRAPVASLKAPAPAGFPSPTHRNPILLFRFAGSFLLRFEARTFLVLLFQEPPRTTAALRSYKNKLCEHLFAELPCISERCVAEPC